MRYFHYYTNETSFDDDYYGLTYLEPWVSLIENIERVDYNKSFDGYVKFDILSNGQIKWKSNNANITRTIEYSKNGSKWESITSNTGGASINVVSGDVVYFRGENESYAEVIDPDYVSGETPDPYNNRNIRTVSFDGTTCNFNLSGNIMSLIKKDRPVFSSLKNLSGECNFYGMFKIGNNKLKSIENLSLPATGLTNACYAFMFTSADTNNTMELPSTKMKNSCYWGMFRGCTNLAAAPELPATTLAGRCYYGMFDGCTSLTTAPELPATTLAEYCYLDMLRRCTRLTTAPELPATTLAGSCYENMFNGCTSLTTAPELPATTLAGRCYYGMFDGCTSLTTAPELPATILTRHCYCWMFKGCTSLTGGLLELPALEIVDGCYNGVFSGCTNLETAPKILATTGGNVMWAMEDMFNGCSRIDSLVCMISHFSGYAPTNRWLNGVKEPGTFYKNPSNTETNVRSNDRIPSTWTVVDYTG